MNEQQGYNVVKIGKLKTFLLGGEGLGIEVKGPATLYLQSKNMLELKAELTRLLDLEKYMQKGSQFNIGIGPGGGREDKDTQGWRWGVPRI